ncbi:MAG: cytochrome C [Crocinitomicaceae bacterium]|nr:cytochrome C [Crocinitomicaceae bacterium]|tara:strand:+ start:4834 stop:5334 length:501 start_codon:yes stop_codon:yes gene_type:complete
MNRLIQIILAAGLIVSIGACGGGGSETAPAEKKKTTLGGAKEKKAPKEEKSDEVGDPMTMKGIGPVQSLEVGDLDDAMVTEGKEIFEANCTACHKIDKKFVGPAMKGITERRTPEWVMNMILNPEEMIKEDPLAKQVMIESNMAIMANQSLTEDQARKIYEYFRTL